MLHDYLLTVQKDRRALLILFALIGVCIAVVFAALASGRGSRSLLSSDLGGKTPVPSVQPTPLPEPTFTLLLMGRGGAGHDGGALADTIVLVRLLEQQQRIVVLSLPRDLWVNIPYDGQEGTEGKLNSAYAIGIDARRTNKAPQYQGKQGGGELAKAVVTSITGISIDRYATIDFTGFEQAIDRLGGVSITVDQAFTDYEYPIAGRESLDCATYVPGSTPSQVSLADLLATQEVQPESLPELPRTYPCRYERVSFQKGIVRMDGKTALQYVRSRHSNEDGNDFSRSRRQRRLLEAVGETMVQVTTLPKLPSFLSALSNHIDTDLTASDILHWTPRAQEIRKYPVSTIALTSDNYLTQGYSTDRQFILKPKTGDKNFTAIQNWIAHTMNPSIPLNYPTIEIIGNWKNASMAAALKDRLDGAGYPTTLGPLAMKPSTQTATLQQRKKLEPVVESAIRSTIALEPLAVVLASPSASTQADLTILLP